MEEDLVIQFLIHKMDLLITWTKLTLCTPKAANKPISLWNTLKLQVVLFLRYPLLDEFRLGQRELSNLI